MAIFFVIFMLCTIMFQPSTLNAQEELGNTCSLDRKPQAKPTPPAPSQNPIQYVYIPYTPGQPMPPLPQAPQSTDPHAPQIQYVYVPYTPGQQPTLPAQPNGVVSPSYPSQQHHNDDGPNVADVMTTFAGVLGGIVAMGMGAEYDNPEQEAQGLNMFIQSGTQLISLLTKQPYTEEQFAHMYIRSAHKLSRTRELSPKA